MFLLSNDPGYTLAGGVTGRLLRLHWGKRLGNVPMGGGTQWPGAVVAPVPVVDGLQPRFRY